MMRTRCVSGIALWIVAWSALPALAADALTGRAWVDMDYGPYVTASVTAPQPEGNIAYKGVTIRLKGQSWGAGDGAWMVFDTDLLRFSAGWTGRSIDWHSVVFDGGHNANPSIGGAPVFTTAKAPGWSAPSASAAHAFDDPRIRGRDGKPYGPLPHDWAHWKGLYLHGDRVVLSYTVGKTAVLESAGLEERGGAALLSRTVNLGPRTAALTMRVIDEPAAPGTPGIHGSVLSRGKAGDGAAADSALAARTVWLRGDSQPTRPDAPAVDPAELNKGLVAHWTFDDLAGGAAVNVAGMGHAGKLDAAAASAAATAAKGVEGGALALDGRGEVRVDGSDAFDFGGADYTIAAWIRTTAGGTIISKAPAKGNWAPEGKTFFVRGGRLSFDIGWVGVVTSKQTVGDGQWHHVAATYTSASKTYRLYVDGAVDAQKRLDIGPDVADHVVRIGFTSPNFPRNNQSRFRGAIDELRVYKRVLGDRQIQALAGVKIQPQVTLVGCVGGPAGLKWVEAADGVKLSIPPGDKAAFKLLFWRGPGDGVEAVVKAVNTSPPAQDLAPLTKGGPPRWSQKLSTQASVGPDTGAFAVDKLTPPMQNPWHSWMRFGGFDFFKGGRRAAVCTWSGDVWLVDGIAPGAELGQLTWRRIATGLFQPLGLKIVDGDIYVLGRDQIIILRDLNGDGETDFYENFNNDAQVTEHFHEFAMDLQLGPDGDFYYTKAARHALDAIVPQHGTLLRVARDGSRTDIICHGFRAPNGLGFGPHGEIVSSDQEGHWTPMNRINFLKPGGFYGNMMSYHPGGVAPTDYDRPVCWIHKSFDRSPAEQLWVNSAKWGALNGELIALSYGTGRIQHVMYEEVNGQVQGGVTLLPLEFDTGVMRGRFNPADGQLYLCGLFGWSSNKTVPGGFFRVRATGKPFDLPMAIHATKGGVVITFTRPLDKAAATDAGAWAVQAWNYRWLPRYGSDDWRVSDPQKKGRDDLTVQSVTLSRDGRSVYLHVPDMTTCMQMQIDYDIQAADGAPIRSRIMNTVYTLRQGPVPGVAFDD